MGTVLLVDDHAMIRDGLRMAIRQIDPALQVATAPTGQAALDLARVLVALEVVVMDFYLPDIGGAALVQRLRQRSPTLKILVLSASEDPMDARMVLEAGANGFVHK